MSLQCNDFSRCCPTLFLRVTRNDGDYVHHRVDVATRFSFRLMFTQVVRPGRPRLAQEYCGRSVLGSDELQKRIVLD